MEPTDLIPKHAVSPRSAEDFHLTPSRVPGPPPEGTGWLEIQGYNLTLPYPSIRRTLRWRLVDPALHALVKASQETLEFREVFPLIDSWNINIQRGATTL